MKRSLLTGVALWALLAACSQNAEQDRSAAGGSSDLRKFVFSYTAHIPRAPKGTRQLAIWVPLPLHDPGIQEVADLRWSVNGDESLGERTQEHVFGNQMLYVKLDAPAQETVVRWSATVTRFADTGQGRLPVSPRFLQANRLIPLGTTAHQEAARLGIDRAEQPVAARARVLFNDVLDSMEYNKQVPGYGLGDFKRSLAVCKGNCTDFHARFIGTGRAGGIPCRFTMGIPMKPDPEGSYNSYHCWAHWFDGQHWRPVDISEADKVAAQDPQLAAGYFGHLDPNRIAVSIGRDVILSPPQAAGPLNYFVFPHVEADGTPLTLDKSMWSFDYKNVRPDDT